jgi:GxxExxY protein
MHPNDITREIISAAMKVHSALGPGLLESAYEVCLAYELVRMGQQVELPVIYEGIRLDAGYRMDLVVDDYVVVELKAAETMLPVYDAQLLSYLKPERQKGRTSYQFQGGALERWNQTFRESIEVLCGLCVLCGGKDG